MWTLLAGVTIITFAPILVKAIDAGPTLIGAYRTGIGTLLLLPALMMACHQIWTQFRLGNGSQQKSILGFILLAGTVFAFDMLTWHRSILYVGAGLGTLLANTQAIYLAIFGAIFRGEAVTKSLLGGIVLALSGILLLCGVEPAEASHYWLGIFLGCIAGMSYAVFIICFQKIGMMSSELTALQKLALISAVSSVFLFAVGEVAGETVNWSWTTLILFLCLGGIVHVGGWTVIGYALPKLPIAKAGLIMLSQPVFATILGMILFQETMTPLQMGGASLILLGIYLGNRR